MPSQKQGDRRVQQVPDNDVGVWELTSVCEGHERALTQIQRDNPLHRAKPQLRVPPLPASPPRIQSGREIPAVSGLPSEKLLLVIVAKIAPARPFLRKSRSRLEVDGGEIAGKRIARRANRRIGAQRRQARPPSLCDRPRRARRIAAQR